MSLVLALLLVGCQGPSAVQADKKVGGQSAEEFLRWSMDQHKQLKAFAAECDWSNSYDGHSAISGTHRQIQYVAPNVFKVIATNPGGFMLTSISDGNQMVEYTKGVPGPTPAMLYPAPSSLAAVSTMQMEHPMFCGSLLWKFFGGGDNLDSMADKAKGPIEFGNEEKAAGGEQARNVTFYGAESYGHTTALIGEKTGDVYKISYDSEPLLQRLASDQLPAEVRKRMGNRPVPKSSITTESYLKIRKNPDLQKAAFVAKAPEGQKVVDARKANEPQPPVPIGSPAPDFEVASVSDGRPVRLSSLRGKVVLVDFWATWCGPCRKGLPGTDAIYKEFHDKGLTVLAVSDEGNDVIQPFWKEAGYAMPAYRDKDKRTSSSYQVVAIPTTVIIGRDGKLAGFLVGLHPDEEVRAILKKAGVS